MMAALFSGWLRDFTADLNALQAVELSKTRNCGRDGLRTQGVSGKSWEGQRRMEMGVNQGWESPIGRAAMNDGIVEGMRAREGKV